MILNDPELLCTLPPQDKAARLKQYDGRLPLPQSASPKALQNEPKYDPTINKQKDNPQCSNTPTCNMDIAITKLCKLVSDLLILCLETFKWKMVKKSFFL